jgi:hypothetical protein
VIPYSFHDAALQEYRKAAEYYDKQRIGLGDRFVEEVELAIQIIRHDPEKLRYFELDFRSVKTRIFPYRVIYAMENGEVLIYAIMHLHRRPGYWTKRRR